MYSLTQTLGASTLLLLVIFFQVGCNGCRPTASPAPASVTLTADVIERHNQGVARMGQFDYAGAREKFLSLSEEFPDWDDVQVDLAISTLNRQETGDSARASEILDGVIKSHPDNLRAYYCRGILALDTGDPATALRMFSHVAEADPSDAYAAYYVGLCKFQKGDYQEALSWYEKSIETDGYLKSALYGAFQACLRTEQQEQAERYRAMFDRMETNPQARVAEIKYTRMGDKAEVSVLSVETDAEKKLPEGAIFQPAVPLPFEGADIVTSDTVDQRTSVTVCDLNHDGRLDFFLAGVEPDSKTNRVLINVGENFVSDEVHPLAQIADVNAAAWGDFDNDGLTDVYLCRNGTNQLWRQTADGWQDVTESTGTGGQEIASLDALFVDADHDGDLDLLVANDGANELFSNNLDGTFRPLAADRQIGGSSRTIQVLASDLDHDRDLDLVMLNEQPPHRVYRNDRLWNYETAVGFGQFTESAATAVVAVDGNVDGQVELLTLTSGVIVKWQPDDEGNWQQQSLTADTSAQLKAPIAVSDVNGDGQHELVVSTSEGWIVLDTESGNSVAGQSDYSGPWCVAHLQPELGPSILSLPAGMQPQLWQPGAGRWPFLSLSFTGKDESGEQMRSNRSGIGVRATARIGGRWIAFDSLRSDSGPGQGLQPISIGSIGATQIDFVQMTWPDGVFQTESALAAGQVHSIDETQRQVASCPVVFAWNGNRFEFVTDVLGVAGLGFNVSNGEYGTPRPWEHLLLPSDSLQPRDDRLLINVGEPMEEILYLDEARLVAYDLPTGWQMVIDERFSANELTPTGRPIFFQEDQVAAKVVNDRGEDVTSELTSVDGRAAAPGASDRRFLGICEPHHLVLEFEEAINADQLVLIIDGWIEYPYSQTTFAAWQAGVVYQPPTIEAEDEQGNWQTVLEQFGYMAGMPRRASVPLDSSRLPTETTRLRIATNMEIYWDRLAVAKVKPSNKMRRHNLDLLEARATEIGFPTRTTLSQRRPHYDYHRRSPLWDTRHPKGMYTEFGDVSPLVIETDDAVAVIGPGEEVQLSFATCQQELPNGWTRRYVLELNGWCKDMDLFTQHGDTVQPLPQRVEGEQNPHRHKLHEKYNRRYRAGY